MTRSKTSGPISRRAAAGSWRRAGPIKPARSNARRVALAAALFLAAASGTRPAAAQDTTRRKLTRTEVLAALASASPQRPADLTHTDLAGLDLSRLDFKEANLARSLLVGTRFAAAHLFGVRLDGVDARDADFTGAVLDVIVARDADFTHAIFRDASLYAAILTGSNFTGADLRGARVIAAAQGARFPHAQLAGVRMGADPGNQPMGIMRTDLTGADLTDADLTDADVRKTVFTRADLTGATLRGADVAGAIFHSVRGRDTLRGWSEARHTDKIIADP